jgi:hypothetical protein
MPPAWYSLFSMLRVVAVLWLVAVAWLRARDRWGRRGTAEDPAPEHDDLAGPLAGAEDRLIVRFA